jgi:hypothetical protein
MLGRGSQAGRVDRPGKPSAGALSAQQQLQLDLIRSSSFNLFDGDRVVRDLLERRDEWSAVLMDRDDLIKLRDLPDGHWNVDTLYVLARDPYSAHALSELAEIWHADTVDVYGAERTDDELGGSPDDDCRVVAFWWD